MAENVNYYADCVRCLDDNGERNGYAYCYVFYVDVPDRDGTMQRIQAFYHMGHHHFQSEEEWHNFTVALWMRVWSCLADEARGKNIDPTTVWLDKDQIIKITERWKPEQRREIQTHETTNPVVTLT